MRRLHGDAPKGMVHIRDAVDGILLAVERGEGAYILADVNATFNEFLRLCEEASGLPAPKRSIGLGTLRAAARVVQAFYGVRGKVPPISRAVVRSMEVPMTYTARRAVERLGWKPDIVARLKEDFEALRASRAN
jgi:dihydroflavonol-4-reductase